MTYRDTRIRTSMSKKESLIWKHFKVAEDSQYAICNVTSCNESMSHRGQTTKILNTSNLAGVSLKVEVQRVTQGIFEEAI